MYGEATGRSHLRDGAATDPSSLSTLPRWLVRWTPADDRVLLGAFAILFGLVAAALSGYRYAYGDQTEQLPIILRFIDSDYLVNDFFVNAATEFGPRFYYGHAVALLAAHAPLPLVAGVLWLSTFIALALVTAFAAKSLTGSATGGMVAVVLVASPTFPFDLGGTYLFDPYLTPRFVAWPFALFALWKGVENEPVKASVASVPAVAFHPQVGLEVAVLALVAATVRRITPMAGRREVSLRPFLSVGLGLLVTGLAALLWIVPSISTGAVLALQTDEFMRIHAYFRHPHFLPSAWDWQQWALGAAFVAAVVIALFEAFRGERCWGRTRSEHLGRGLAIAVLLACIGAALIGGYVFVELVPTRAGVVAHPFRLLVVVIWLGWILIAGLAADRIARRDWRWAALSLASAASPLALLLCKTVTGPAARLRDGALMRSTAFFLGVALAVAASVVAARIVAASPRIVFCLALCLGVLAVLAISADRRLAPAAMIGLVGVLMLTLAAFALDRNGVLPSSGRVSSYAGTLQPVLSLNDLTDRHNRYDEDADVAELAAVARDATDSQSVFLIPWKWSTWRLLADRAVVVEYKSYPFRDTAIREWYERYLEIYEKGGYPDRVTEPGLLELHGRYGFDYAVLPLGTDVPSFPVLASSGDWKLVRVARTHPEQTSAHTLLRNPVPGSQATPTGPSSRGLVSSNTFRADGPPR